MKEVTHIEFTEQEVLNILQEHVNKQRDKNHLFYWYKTELPKTLSIIMVKYDKDEESH